MSRHEDILQFNISVLDNSQRVLILNLGAFQAFRALGSQECLDIVTICCVSCPNNDVISKCCISNPSLLSIEKISSVNFGCCGFERGCITTIIGLSKSKANELVHIHRLGKDPLPLFVIAKCFYDILSYSIVYQVEGCNGWIAF